MHINWQVAACRHTRLVAGQIPAAPDLDTALAISPCWSACFDDAEERKKGEGKRRGGGNGRVRLPEELPLSRVTRHAGSNYGLDSIGRNYVIFNTPARAPLHASPALRATGRVLGSGERACHRPCSCKNQPSSKTVQRSDRQQCRTGHLIPDAFRGIMQQGIGLARTYLGSCERFLLHFWVLGLAASCSLIPSPEFSTGQWGVQVNSIP